MKAMKASRPQKGVKIPPCRPNRLGRCVGRNLETRRRCKVTSDLEYLYIYIYIYILYIYTHNSSHCWMYCDYNHNQHSSIVS